MLLRLPLALDESVVRAGLWQAWLDSQPGTTGPADWLTKWEGRQI
jgi:hypothetical protein